MPKGESKKGLGKGFLAKGVTVKEAESLVLDQHPCDRVDENGDKDCNGYVQVPRGKVSEAMIKKGNLGRCDVCNKVFGEDAPKED